jgi:hypothetical protein
MQYEDREREKEREKKRERKRAESNVLTVGGGCRKL